MDVIWIISFKITTEIEVRKHAFCVLLPGGALGYFLGGYVPPGTPNWHPVLKKFLLKLIPLSRNGPIFYTPF